jgi:aerotolerance regulator-like protein/VWA domain-containing protein
MFANPLALFALSLLALPILIHLLARFGGRRVLFPTLRFLQPEQSPRLAIKKIARWPLLLLRLLAIGLLILAISGPTLPGAKPARALVILLDASLSMNTEAARDFATGRAREVVSSLGAEELAAIAQFDDSVKLLCDFTKDRAALEQAIAAYGPRFGEAQLGAALMWASAKLSAQSQNREVILISDLQATNVSALKPIRLDGVDLKIMRVNNQRRANARIDRAVARATKDALEVDSTAIFDDGKSVSIQPSVMKIALNQTNASSAESNATLLAAKIGDDLVAGVIAANRADDFDADDNRFFVARVADERKTLIIQPRSASANQATFIEKALQANGGTDASRALIEIKDALPQAPDALSDIRALIAPLDALSDIDIAAALTFARKGGSLILTAGAEADVTRAAEMLRKSDANFASFALDSVPLIDSLSLRVPSPQASGLIDNGPLLLAESAPAFASVRFRQALSVQINGGEILLRYSNNQPAAARLRVGAGQVTLLGFGLSDKDSTLARSSVYPAFIAWLLDDQASLPRVANLTIGQTSSFILLEGLTGLTKIYFGSGQRRTEVVGDYKKALEEPGVYEAASLSGRMVFALNAPVSESSIAQSSEQELLERITTSGINFSNSERSGAIRYRGSRLWWILAAGAFAISLMELAWSFRKRREL